MFDNNSKYSKIVVKGGFFGLIIIGTIVVVTKSDEKYR
jgi:hypothetical protein